MTIVITGMHRSGTSFVASVAQALGLDLGATSYLMPPDAGNPEGYFENLLVFRFNENLLGIFGGEWWRPPGLPPLWHRHPLVEQKRDAAAAIVDLSFRRAGSPRGIKDPRMGLLLPFWRRVVDVDKTILVVRDPVAVATSVQARDGFDTETAAGLWTHYVSAAWVNAPDRIVVSYDAMLDDLDAHIELLRHALGVTPTDEQFERARSLARAPRAAAAGTVSGPRMRFATMLHDAVTAGDDALVSAISSELHERSTAHGVAIEENIRSRAELEALTRTGLRLRERVEWALKHPGTVPGLVKGKVRRTLGL